MLSSRIVLKRGGKGEAEKPFWISYADLMTALMVLFLVTMSVTLLAVTKQVSEAERQKAERDREIAELLHRVQVAAKNAGISVDMDRNVIDFGDKAHFDKNSSGLKPEQQRLLRTFVPQVLAIARDPLGQKWLKQIVVEGFSSPEGDYLYNLNLSLQRSQRVLCVLLAKPPAGETGMSNDELEQIRDLFLVGGYSFNAAKASYEDSRRVELRLEFLGIGEHRPSTNGAPRGNFGTCALGAS
ncbi:outer membrane protein OmpA-like peptidoglycan-associated protein [Paraburkholderia fungorum]|jgi:outer membrane protein OmpA-like peptidoglycan-associated protein|uniref:flagellar motor protein MotB n=1 Tax=Paraburkholderia fungorum TaxID=134537 RepID=UPI000D067A7F|nr:flagellar motor protein MotB [Paraburkholderia fungorum]PRZ55819.1 outer membrane protein OmpA-like peptidoglycan-associated protein [Paraburkholderia fungorum]